MSDIINTNRSEHPTSPELERLQRRRGELFDEVALIDKAIMEEWKRLNSEMRKRRNDRSQF